MLPRVSTAQSGETALGAQQVFRGYPVAGELEKSGETCHKMASLVEGLTRRGCRQGQSDHTYKRRWTAIKETLRQRSDQERWDQSRRTERGAAVRACRSSLRGSVHGCSRRRVCGKGAESSARAGQRETVSTKQKATASPKMPPSRPTQLHRQLQWRHAATQATGCGRALLLHRYSTAAVSTPAGGAPPWGNSSAQ